MLLHTNWCCFENFIQFPMRPEKLQEFKIVHVCTRIIIQVILNFFWVVYLLITCIELFIWFELMQFDRNYISLVYQKGSNQSSAECMLHQQKQSVTDGRIDRLKDEQNDPFMTLCFAGTTKITWNLYRATRITWQWPQNASSYNILSRNEGPCAFSE